MPLKPRARRARCQPQTFKQALRHQRSRHGDSAWSLTQRLTPNNQGNVYRQINRWEKGSVPCSRASFAVISKIERIYDLESGYFAEFLVSSRPRLRTGCRFRSFRLDLDFQMRKHGDTGESLAATIYRKGESKHRAVVINRWRTGECRPRGPAAFRYLARIESRYRLPKSHFSSLLAREVSAGQLIRQQANKNAQRIFAWHLPKNFDRRPREEQVEIVSWIKSNIIGGVSERATQDSYAIVFRSLTASLKGGISNSARDQSKIGRRGAHRRITIEAPSCLTSEVRALVRHQTARVPELGIRRHLRWSPRTAGPMVHHLGAMLGSLAAAKESAIAGLGVPATKLTLALLALPSFWDWYLRWRERNRRCKTSTELTLLYLGKTLLRPHTGWLRQHPRLVKHLHAIDGLIQQCEVKLIRLNWAAACDAAYVYVTDRIGELLRDNRQAGDPFEAIAAVLNTDEPLIEYKKIADEIRKDIPRRPKFSLQAAIAARSYITVRILMHLGLRQRNARELLLCQKDQKPRTMQQLEVMERGELRWSESLRRWEVIIPAIAFKNGKSSYFRGCPYRATLADVDRLYYFLDQYIRHYRPILVGKFPDPGTLIVKTASCAAYSGSFDGVTFYHLWKTIIRRYGIFNPYTRRGAVKGLLPHGPHCVRDVIATHVLKVTGSYELAGFAIQDNAQTVARHYARFLPHEKADRAARVLDQVWSRK